MEQISIHAAHLDFPCACAIQALRIQAWPHIAQHKDDTAENLRKRWRDYSGTVRHRPAFHLVFAAGELIAVAHTFSRTIASADGEMTIMALASVCVAERARGCGYGRMVVRAAFDRVDHGDFEFSLFQTTPAVAPFYRQLGAVDVSNRFFNSCAENPAANPFWDPIAMRYPLDGRWPQSDIDLRGPGF